MPTQLAPIDQKRFDFIVQTNPFLARQFMQLLAERLASMNARLNS